MLINGVPVWRALPSKIASTKFPIGLTSSCSREIAEQTVKPKELNESIITGLQKILPDDEDEADEIGSLSQSAEALRITASAPTRSTSIGADYDGS